MKKDIQTIEAIICGGCQKMGSDCINVHFLCVDCAVKRYRIRLDSIIDPAGEGFAVYYDVNINGYMQLTGFSAKWKKGGCEFDAIIPLSELI